MGVVQEVPMLEDERILKAAGDEAIH